MSNKWRPEKKKDHTFFFFFPDRLILASIKHFCSCCKFLPRKARLLIDCTQVRGSCTRISELTAAPIWTKICCTTYLAWEGNIALMLTLPLQVMSFPLRDFQVKKLGWGWFLVWSMIHLFSILFMKSTARLVSEMSFLRLASAENNWLSLCSNPLDV